MTPAANHQPDKAKLLDAWMEFEKGEASPGKVLSDLKKAGLRQVLDELNN